MTWFGASNIFVREPGTIIGEDEEGKPVAVEDNNFVTNGRAIYITPNTEKRLRLRPQVETATGEPS
ncbi:MAG: hypothetical protein KDJ69_12235 [Nitratireductor sp.]|nr:hypothetical protein [Nitratireductor sp.]